MIMLIAISMPYQSIWTIIVRSDEALSNFHVTKFPRCTLHEGLRLLEPSGLKHSANYARK